MSVFNVPCLSNIRLSVPVSALLLFMIDTLHAPSTASGQQQSDPSRFKQNILELDSLLDDLDHARKKPGTSEFLPRMLSYCAVFPFRVLLPGCPDTGLCHALSCRVILNK